MLRWFFNLIAKPVPGPVGPPGPQADSSEPGLIKLPIEVIVVASDYGNLNRLPSIQQALENSKPFWAGIGIALRPSVSAIQADESILNFTENDLLTLHYWQVGKRFPCLYVGSESERVGGGADMLGQANGNGIAIVAGNTPVPGGDTLIDEIMDHELGHILGLGHEDGTFMRAALETSNRTVTPTQRAVLLENAELFG
jgi:hypothetical protein